MEESMMTELAPVVGLRALIVEVTNPIGVWDGGERRYPSVSWETYVLCSYVWGRVRSILLLAVQVSPDNTRFGVRAEFTQLGKFSSTSCVPMHRACACEDGLRHHHAPMAMRRLISTAYSALISGWVET
jgi:hypothetical protein